MSNPGSHDDDPNSTLDAEAGSPAPAGGLEPTVRRRALERSDPGDDATRVRADPLVGATLGEYRVLERLGEGGMSLVYRGEQPVIGRAVAIKVLKKEFADDPAHARRFLEEARSVSAARHPGIVDIFSFGSLPGGEPYLVMDLLEGASLDVVLAERGALPPEEVVALLLPMLSALSAAHLAGIIHRDLKPANIFVVKLRDGTTYPKLLDFGLARRGEAGQRVRQTSVGGTPLYIAPEQARGEAVGPQTDLYSLGCVIYELLVGRPPFSEGNLHSLLDQHASLVPVPVRTLKPDLPRPLERLVQQLLAKDPAERPESALAVRKRLEELQGTLGQPAARARTKSRRAEVITEPDRAPVTRRESAVTDPDARPVHHEAATAAIPVLVPRPSRPAWVVPAVIGGVVATLGLMVALQLSGLFDAPPLPRAVVAPVEPEVVKPPASRHTREDVTRQWKKLRARAKDLPDDLRRRAQGQLEEAKECGASPEVCWRALSELEQRFFGTE